MTGVEPPGVRKGSACGPGSVVGEPLITSCTGYRSSLLFLLLPLCAASLSFGGVMPGNLLGERAFSRGIYTDS